MILNIEVELYDIEYEKILTKKDIEKIDEDLIQSIKSMTYNIYDEKSNTHTECTLGDNYDIEYLLSKNYLEELKKSVLRI